MSSAKVVWPIQPNSKLATVTPNCVPEMNRVGLALARWTSRAARLPAAASWSIRVERDETSANSVATKKPLAATSSRAINRPVAGDIYEKSEIRSQKSEVRRGGPAHRPNREFNQSQQYAAQRR